MLNVATEWLRSRRPASLGGIELTPIPHTAVAKIPLFVMRGHAAVVFLTDSGGRPWVLKKFLRGHEPHRSYVRALRDLVPAQIGFESGSQRRVLSWRDVGRGFGTWEFAEWIENTILMPRVCGVEWLQMSESLLDGTTTMPEATRVAICRSLLQRVQRLEGAGVSHRDLSATHVFIDPATSEVQVIDWDALYHPSLAMPPNTPIGTSGYLAPFVTTGPVADPRTTWCSHADRYAMAVLCSEFLSLGHRSEGVHDSDLVQQRHLSLPPDDALASRFTSRYPAIGRLLARASRARFFVECPSPDEWLAAPPLSRVIPAPVLLQRDSFPTQFEHVQEPQKKRVHGSSGRPAVRHEALPRRKKGK